jgi:uncharacterized protein YjbI with pentapeptide repeats
MIVHNITSGDVPNALRDKNDRQMLLEFVNVEFDSLSIEEMKEFDRTFEFRDCIFQSISFKDTTLLNKIRFRDCDFHNVNFRNTTFDELADFWRCRFHNATTFFKTDFNKTTVFSGATFDHNVLFTYSFIGERMIFRGTTFKEGLDLSLAIIAGDLSCFEIDLGSTFRAISMKAYDKKEDYEKDYEDFVCDQDEIPIQNKRETFRIIKDHFISNQNFASSVKYKKFENATLGTEIWSRKHKPYSPYHKSKNWFRFNNFMDSITLYLNFISNRHGSSWSAALGFIIVGGGLFFLLSLCQLERYYFTLCLSESSFSIFFEFFPQFIIPTHKFGYLGSIKSDEASFFVFDFVGRLIVGYGLYQFVVAFRKFR